MSLNYQVSLFLWTVQISFPKVLRKNDFQCKQNLAWFFAQLNVELGGSWSCVRDSASLITLAYKPFFFASSGEAFKRNCKRLSSKRASWRYPSVSSAISKCKTCSETTKYDKKMQVIKKCSRLSFTVCRCKVLSREKLLELLKFSMKTVIWYQLWCVGFLNYIGNLGQTFFTLFLLYWFIAVKIQLS